MQAFLFTILRRELYRSNFNYSLKIIREKFLFSKIHFIDEEEKNGSNSTDLTTTTKGTEENADCGEALASASLYNTSGVRLGRLLIRPDRRGTQREAANRRIRITGELTPHA